MKCTPIVLLALLAGCAEADAFLPKVTFEKLDVRAISFEEISTDFLFNVANPNPVEIEMASFSYALDLETIELFSGDNKDGFVLPNRGDSELVLPVNLVFADAWNTVQATRGEDVVDFGLNGHFGFNTPLGEMRIPYDEAGDFPALRTPKFSFKAIRLTNINIWAADLEVDLGVVNEHKSSLFFDNFDYAMDLGGQSVASGLLQTFDVEGDTEGTVSLPISIDLLTAGVTLVDAIIGRGNLDVGLAAGVDVDTPFGIIPLSIDETGRVQITE